MADANSNQVAWKVITQNETTRPDDTGHFTAGVLITFQTTTGLNGTVFVPNNQYTSKYVKEVIQEKVNRMSEIQGLKG